MNADSTNTPHIAHGPLNMLNGMLRWLSRAEIDSLGGGGAAVSVRLASRRASTVAGSRIVRAASSATTSPGTPTIANTQRQLTPSSR